MLKQINRIEEKAPKKATNWSIKKKGHDKKPEAKKTRFAYHFWKIILRKGRVNIPFWVETWSLLEESVLIQKLIHKHSTIKHDHKENYQLSSSASGCIPLTKIGDHHSYLYFWDGSSEQKPRASPEAPSKGSWAITSFSYLGVFFLHFYLASQARAFYEFCFSLHGWCIPIFRFYQCARFW